MATDKHFACQSRKMVHWQAFCLSIAEECLTDKHFACQLRKMPYWQAFCLSINENASLTSILLVNYGKCLIDKHFACQSRKMPHWQAFCLSIKENASLTSILLVNQRKCFTDKEFRFKKTIHQFFPVDTTQMSRKFLDHWKPSLAIFIDSEIWPNMILNLKKKKDTNNTFKRSDNKKIFP